MRKLIMWNLVTLDGFFEGTKSWDLSFHEQVWGDELEQFAITQAHEADLLLFGRVTFEGMAAYWKTQTSATESGAIAAFMNRVAKVVVSRTLTHADWNNSRIISSQVDAEVLRLKQAPGKDILIFGSANLCATLMRANLIDEYRLCLCPLVLGAGRPLFRSGDRLRMRLLDARPLTNGAVILRYEPKNL